MTDDRRPAVRAIGFLAPPETNVEAAQARAWSELLATFSLLAGREMASEAQEWFKSRFKVSAAPDRRSRSVLRFVSAQPERSAIIVADAGIYRDREVEPYVASGAATALLPEDIWVPQVHALAAAGVEIARDQRTALQSALKRSQGEELGVRRSTWRRSCQLRTSSLKRSHLSSTACETAAMPNGHPSRVPVAPGLRP